MNFGNGLYYGTRGRVYLANAEQATCLGCKWDYSVQPRRWSGLGLLPEHWLTSELVVAFDKDVSPKDAVAALKQVIETIAAEG